MSCRIDLQLFSLSQSEPRYTSNKTSAKVYPIQIVLFCIHVSTIDYQIQPSSDVSRYSRNLSNVIRYSVEQTLADVFWRERLLLTAFFKYFADSAGDHRRFQTKSVVVLTINIPNEHIDHRVVSSF